MAAPVVDMQDLLNTIDANIERFQELVPQLFGLLDLHPDLLEARSMSDSTPLMLASAAGHFDAVHNLKDRGADMHAEGPNDGRSIDIACLHGRVDVVNIFKESGISLYSKNSSSKTPLMYAVSGLKCEAENRELVTLLLDCREGNDLNARDKDGWTALMWAYSYVDHVEALLAAGADWTIKNKDGHTLRDIVAAGAAMPVDPATGWTEEKRTSCMRTKTYLEGFERANQLCKVYRIHNIVKEVYSLLLQPNAPKSPTYTIPGWVVDRLEKGEWPPTLKFRSSVTPSVGPAAAFSRSRKRASHPLTMVCRPGVLQKVLDMDEKHFTELVKMMTSNPLLVKETGASSSS